MTKRNYRKDLIRIVTFLGGIYFFIEFLLPEFVLEQTGVADYNANIRNGFILIGTMAAGLGLINLFMVHGTKVAFRRKDWSFSLLLLVGLVLMMGATILDWRAGSVPVKHSTPLTSLRDFTESIVKDSSTPPKTPVPTRETRIEALHNASIERISTAETGVQRLLGVLAKKTHDKQKVIDEDLKAFSESVERVRSYSLEQLMAANDQALRNYGKAISDAGLAYSKLLRVEYDLSTMKRFWLLIYEGLYVSLGSAMFSLLGVYIASAAYRAFRIKTIESSLMMMTATIVMLGQIPFYVYIYDSLPEVRQWLLEIPNSAGFRAIKIGASVAGLVMAFRMWFSIESESFSPGKRG